MLGSHRDWRRPLASLAGASRDPPQYLVTFHKYPVQVQNEIGSAHPIDSQASMDEVGLEEKRKGGGGWLLNTRHKHKKALKRGANRHFLKEKA